MQAISVKLAMLFVAAFPLCASAQFQSVVIDYNCNVTAGEYQLKQAGYKEIYSKCGNDLIKEGWVKTSNCHDGHQWFYVLRLEERDTSDHPNISGYRDIKPPMFCEGINSRGGPTESPCVPIKSEHWEIINDCEKRTKNKDN